MAWVFKVQMCLLVGATFQICYMLQIFIINTDMTQSVNRKAAIFATLSSFQAISFALFAFEYYETALS